MAFLNSRYVNRRYLCTALVSLIGYFALVTHSDASAQVTDERRANRRTFVEGLLRGLLESQIEKSQNVPQRVVYPQPMPTAPNRQNAISGEMDQLRTTLQNWSDECDHLIGELRQAELSMPTVRPLLADALQLRVNIDLLARRAQNVPQPIYLVDDFRAIDQQWRSINYGLQRLPAVVTQSRQCIGLCNQYNQQMVDLFNISPQFDTQLVTQLASQLSTSLHHLSQNLRYEVRQEPARSYMIRQCDSLRQLIQQSLPVVRRGDYNAVTSMYKQGLNQWRTLNRTICEFPSPRLRRDVQDIEGIGRELRQQLFIPYEIDREYLAQLSANVGQSANSIFQQVTLQDLIAMPNAAVVVESARSFQQQCNRFSASLLGGVNQNELASQFIQFETSWNNVYPQGGVMKNQAMELELGEINYAMQTLRESFGTQPLLDHSSMLRISTGLEDLSHELENRVATSPNSIKRPVKKFHERCFELNQKTLADRFYEPKNSELNQLASSWKQLKRALKNYRGINAGELNALRQQIEPLMVKLQVIYSQ